jgi:Zn-dependent protease
MRWAWTIGKIKGIPIRLHVTLLLMLPFAAVIFSMQFKFVAQQLGIAASSLIIPPLAWGGVLAVCLFVAILLHELAHSLVAISSGARVHSITLLIVGGVSRIMGEIRSPGKEAWMAAAGPLASLGIGAVSFGLFLLVTPLFPDLSIATLIFAITNGMLGIFNFLPAFPMDGGRILRAGLTPPLGRVRATKVAAMIGKVFAVAFGIWGIFQGNPLLPLVAIFIFFGASAEARGVEMREALAGVQVGSLVDERLGRVEGSIPVPEVAAIFLRQNYVAALVPGVAGARPRFITYPDLEKAKARGQQMTAGELAMEHYPVAKTTDDVADVLMTFNRKLGNVILVLGPGGVPVGVVTAPDLMRAAMLHKVIQAPQGRQVEGEPGPSG